MIYNSNPNGLNSSLAYQDAIGLESESGGKEFTITLPAGYYPFFVQNDKNEDSIQGAINYTALTDTPIEGSFSGGLRIKSVTNIPLTGLALTKKYRYTDGAGFSSGHSNYNSVDQYSIFREVHVPATGLYEEFFFNVYNSFITQRTGSGTPHYYTSVFEDDFDGTNDLTTRTDFTD